ERRLTFHQHASAARHDQRRVTRELDRIAVSLLGVQQDGAVIEMRPIPARLWESIRFGSGLLEPPFVFGKSAWQIASQKIEQREIPVGGGHFRTQPYGLFQRLPRLFPTAQQPLRIAEIVQRLVSRRAERQRLLETAQAG